MVWFDSIHPLALYIKTGEQKINQNEQKVIIKCNQSIRQPEFIEEHLQMGKILESS